METVMAIMSTIFLGIISLLLILVQLQTPKYGGCKGAWLPSVNNIAKREFEIFSLFYTCCWISAFAVVIATQAYEKFNENDYMTLCVSLAAPFLLQPIFWPLPSERNLPLHLRYSVKANIWIAIFSFIGNYWYTHYFYSVLQAKYTFPAHRLNHVPISLFFATHFYFVTYHTFSNCILRKIESAYQSSLLRSLLFWVAILAFAYFTAFMETFTISSFPYYSFPPEIKGDIYSKGSAFYAIYFIGSFPVFYRIDEKVSVAHGVFPHTIFQTIFEVLGTSMAVLLMLDFCRLFLGIPLNIGGVAFQITPKLSR